MLVARQLTKSYPSGGRTLTVLRDVSFTIPEAPSSRSSDRPAAARPRCSACSPDSTRPRAGSVLLDGDRPRRLDRRRARALRGEKVGFVFQSFQLIPTLTALENVAVPLELRGDARRRRARTRRCSTASGSPIARDHFPAQLSGGEQQRVAHRARVREPPRVLFADEPTGNLDAATGDRDHRAARGAQPRIGHDGRAGHARPRRSRPARRRVIRLNDGAVVEDREIAA